MKNMYYLSQVSSKDNILQLLNMDLWCDIEDMVVYDIRKNAAITIQKYYKKHRQNIFIPNLISYIEAIYYNIYIQSGYFYNILMYFDNLNLKRIDCFNILTKCKCCDVHISINNELKNIGLNDSINYIDNLEVITNCKCECYRAATLYCITCFDE